MSQSSGTRTLTGILSIATRGSALCFSMSGAVAADMAKDKNVTEYPILRAQAPE